VDLAQAVAIIGMVMVHFREPVQDTTVGLAEVLYSLPRGRASILFVVLAAVAITLAATAGGRRRRELGLSLLGRSAVLLPLGLALQMQHDRVNVILHFYAVYLALAWLALHLPPRTLLVSAAGWMVLGPVTYLLTEIVMPQWFGAAARLGDPVGLVLRDVLLTGAYPVATWGGPLLFGVWLGRQDLWSATVRRRLVLAGSGVAILAWALSRVLERASGASTQGSAWWRLVLDDSHSEMPLWLVGSTASAVAVLGGCLWLAAAFPRAIQPLSAFGRLALTAYVLQLLLVALVPQVVIHPDVRVAAVSVLVFTVLVTLGATLWLRWFDYGPMEAVVRAPYRWLGGRARTTTSAAASPTERRDQGPGTGTEAIHQQTDEESLWTYHASSPSGSLASDKLAALSAALPLRQGSQVLDLTCGKR